jgi:hypothetical protein
MLHAAFELDAKEGTAKLEQYASWLERQWPDAAASLREGVGEMFTIDRLALPSVLRAARERRTSSPTGTRRLVTGCVA